MIDGTTPAIKCDDVVSSLDNSNATSARSCVAESTDWRERRRSPAVLVWCDSNRFPVSYLVREDYDGVQYYYPLVTFNIVFMLLRLYVICRHAHIPGEQSWVCG